jgi:flagellar biosynthetic protein FliR
MFLPDVAGFLVAFARAVAFLQSAPVSSESTIPHRARVAVAAALALAIAGARPAVPVEELPRTLPIELLAGLAAGFSARLALAGIEAGGQLIGVQLGLGFAQFFDPSAGEEALPTRRIAATLGSLAFILTGGIELSVHALATPVLDAPGAALSLLSVVNHGGEVMAVAVRLAAPCLAAGIVANLAVAIASRAAPALNVFSVMLALGILVGAAALVATAPTLAAEILGAARNAAESVAAVLQR